MADEDRRADEIAGRLGASDAARIVALFERERVAALDKQQLAALEARLKQLEAVAAPLAPVAEQIVRDKQEVLAQIAALSEGIGAVEARLGEQLAAQVQQQAQVRSEDVKALEEGLAKLGAGERALLARIEVVEAFDPWRAMRQEWDERHEAMKLRVEKALETFKAKLDLLDEVQRANRQGVEMFTRAAHQRLEKLELAPAAGSARLQGGHDAIRDQGVIVGSFVWALLKLRKGTPIRRSSWRIEATSIVGIRELVRELDIAPEGDLLAMDWIVQDPA